MGFNEYRLHLNRELKEIGAETKYSVDDEGKVRVKEIGKG
jgi:hypothetical protein